MIRVCVVGCGALGSVYAGHLARVSDVEVWAYDTDEAHVLAINESGLKLSGAASFTAAVRATSDASELPPCELGIVATKSVHTKAAIAAGAHALSVGSVCSLQNGIGNEEVIAEFVRQVIRGSVLPAAQMVGPGHVRLETEGTTWLGPYEASPAPLREIELLADLLTRGGMPAVVKADVRGAQWTKLIFNSAANAVGALTGLRHGRVCELPATRRLLGLIVDEGTAVAKALGIELDADPEELLAEAGIAAYEHKASMLQDVEARRETEVGYLNGGISTFGRTVGIPTPLNDAVWALVQGLEYSWKPPEDSESGV